MKTLFCFICFLLSIPEVRADLLPDVKLENKEGKTISTRTLLREKPLIILFWSTSCKPCLQELKAIDEQLEEWQQEADFDVVAVAIDDSRSIGKAKAMASGFGWEFTCVFDKNQEFKRALNVSLIPQSYVVDAKGKVIYSHSGYTPGSEQILLDKIKELEKK